MNRGFLIVFEGIDGTGKSTQCRLLAESLHERHVPHISLAEPTRGTWGMKIRKLLSEGREGISPQEELSWFVNDRREDIERNIMPALQSNKVVLMDRYYFSTAAYQGALGLDPEQIRLENETFAPVPDRALIFLTSPEICLERIESSRDQKSAFEKLDYLQNVQNIFKSFTGPNIRFIDSVGSLSEVHEKVLAEIEDLFDLDLK
ncbi:MAG: dTMP kinase [Nitrospinae bacterium]|nr:dTMP kinase [Nitrospinota bacterium]MBL7020419.1 dTMP kinase [Nitrospinaceae bacterium]